MRCAFLHILFPIPCGIVGAGDGAVAVKVNDLDAEVGGAGADLEIGRGDAVIFLFLRHKAHF